MIRSVKLRFLLVVTLFGGPAWAQSRVEEPSRVEFFQGPLISSNRVVGMGGAFMSVAEGADAHMVNPASFAVRQHNAADDWFDYDFAISWLNARTGEGTDIDQSGEGAVQDSTFAQGGINVKLGRNGFGGHLLSHSYTIGLPLEQRVRDAEWRQLFGGFGYARAFRDGELVFGGMLVVGKAALRLVDEDANLVEVTGGGLLLGALWAPFGQRYRLGVTSRSEIIGSEVAGDPEKVGELVPEEIVVPWELGWGASYMFGPRPYNIQPGYGVKRPRVVPRRYILVSTEVLLTGPSEGAVSARSFLDGEEVFVGEEASWSGRVGVESEVWANLLVLRAGSYYEPSRFATNSGRLHGTAGLDVRVPAWWEWKLGAVLDATSGFFNFGLGLGFWH